MILGSLPNLRLVVRAGPSTSPRPPGSRSRNLRRWEHVARCLLDDWNMPEKSKRLDPLDSAAVTLGRCIQLARQGRGIRIADAARKAGLREADWRALEDGYRSVSVATLLRSLAALGVSLAELLAGTVQVAAKPRRPPRLLLVPTVGRRAPRTHY